MIRSNCCVARNLIDSHIPVRIGHAPEIPMCNGSASFLMIGAAESQHRNGLAAGSPRTHDSRRDRSNVVCDFRGSDSVDGTDSAIL